jgi:hypothetical protein
VRAKREGMAPILQKSEASDDGEGEVLSVYSWPVTNSGGFLYQGVPVSPMVYTFSDHPRQINPTFGYVAPPPQLSGSYKQVIGKKGKPAKEYVSVL